jgi:hypothetical protein
MSDVRCRACGAAVPSEAQWCSLCFADLREPAPIREQVSVPTAPEPEAAPAAAVAAPLGGRPSPDALLGLPEPVTTAATGDAVAAEGAEPSALQPPERAAVTWPCGRCGEQVEMALDACPTCGAGFLEGATGAVSVHLPVVGDMGKMSRSGRLMVGTVISIIVMIVLVLLATISGHIL